MAVRRHWPLAPGMSDMWLVAASDATGCRPFPDPSSATATRWLCASPPRSLRPARSLRPPSTRSTPIVRNRSIDAGRGSIAREWRVPCGSHVQLVREHELEHHPSAEVEHSVAVMQVDQVPVDGEECKAKGALLRTVIAAMLCRLKERPASHRTSAAGARRRLPTSPSDV